MTRSRLRLTVSAAVLGVVAMNGAHAATGTNTFNVLLTITSACNITTTAPTNVNFGTQPSTATNVPNQGALNVNCTPLAPFTIALDNGLNGTNVNTRAMNNGTTLIPYQLYQTAVVSPTTVWGSTTGTGGNVYSGIGTGLSVPIPVYGNVPSTNVAAGSYSDTITATITY
ncbi:MAG: hypothetical protein GAK28_01678 [Luteibacter sp.]|uniref:Csu type fimbrial protein n=1 Tax=Luteibacter sp. TaxID=1886636 RepID=UPI0013804221|nr:spore coat U domain-containing protein [Luteibacter sp.]KAF1007721.1 MAG: hypothetical protein GAK28_01678 [Luteibacter sp.]